MHLIVFGDQEREWEQIAMDCQPCTYLPKVELAFPLSGWPWTSSLSSLCHRSSILIHKDVLMGGNVSEQHFGPRVQYRHLRKLLLTTELRLVPCRPDSNLSQGTEPSDLGLCDAGLDGWLGHPGSTGCSSGLPPGQLPQRCHWCLDTLPLHKHTRIIIWCELHVLQLWSLLLQQQIHMGTTFRTHAPRLTVS